LLEDQEVRDARMSANITRLSLLVNTGKIICNGLRVCSLLGKPERIETVKESITDKYVVTSGKNPARKQKIRQDTRPPDSGFRPRV
jgi:hypothetical protein